MQITNKTRKLLDGFHGDLKDRLITVTKAELNDPNVNICAGVRWLFEKRRQASIHLRRPASWVETVWEYKGVKRAKTKKEAKLSRRLAKIKISQMKMGTLGELRWMREIIKSLITSSNRGHGPFETAGVSSRR